MKINIDVGRRDCPLCGGSNTLNVSNNEGRVLLHCHKCEAPFKELLSGLESILPAKTYQSPARRIRKQKPTHAEAAAKASSIWEAAGGGK